MGQESAHAVHWRLTLALSLLGLKPAQNEISKCIYLIAAGH